MCIAGGIVMTKSGSKVGITSRALIQRINRKLAPDEVLKTARTERVRLEFGDYYVIDVGINGIIEKDVDLESLGHRLGVLRAWEELVEGS
jgi:hypothetical protein